MKFKELIMWIIVFVVGSLIVSIILNPSYLGNIKEWIPSSSVSDAQTYTDSEIQSCMVEFEKYSKIGEEKFNQINYKLLAVEKYYSEEEADELIMIYGGLLKHQIETLENLNFIEKEKYPSVFIAYKLEMEEGSLPDYVICQDGKLSDAFKNKLVIL